MRENRNRLQPLGEASETRTTLLLALWVIDAFSGNPVVPDRIEFKEFDPQPKLVRNPSGYLLLLDLERDSMGGTVTADGYAPGDFDVDLTALDPREPIETVVLVPNTGYPFPPRTTLVRGHVVDDAGNDVAGVGVSVDGVTDSENPMVPLTEGVTPRAETDAAGEFVIYFTDLVDAEVNRDPNRIVTVSVPADDDDGNGNDPGSGVGPGGGSGGEGNLGGGSGPETTSESTADTEEVKSRLVKVNDLGPTVVFEHESLQNAATADDRSVTVPVPERALTRLELVIQDDAIDLVSPEDE